MHFKELFILDGLSSDISETDIARRNTIVDLLKEWELLDVIDEEIAEEPKASLGQIKIIPHRDKQDWELVPKYHIGKT